MASPRPNRWNGPSSTWRTYTKAERTLYSSLDTLRAQDLSVHLYNAHAIKSRVDGRRKGEGKGKGKSTDNGEIEFIPPDSWTAWPMPADEVPRGPYLPEMGGWRMEEDGRPSGNLEEALLATATRTARERWRGRRWEWNAGKREEDGTKEKMSSEMLVSGREDIAGEGNDEAVADGQTFSSHAPSALILISSASSCPSPSSEQPSRSSETSISRLPVPLADDDHARQILLPSIRHVISKADDLLEGLHKARKAYAGNWNKKFAEDTTTADDTDTNAETSKSGSRTRARAGGRETKKRARTTSVDSLASTKSTASASASSGGRRKPKTKQLKLRDWSDVLGMAALTRWNPDVVARAAERCSRLFGEDMLFRTFEEGSVGGKSDFAEWRAGGDVPLEEEDGGDEERELRPSHSTRNDEGSRPVVADVAIRCPVVTCRLNGHMYARAKNLYDHVRRRHPEVDIAELKKLEARRRGMDAGSGRGAVGVGVGVSLWRVGRSWDKCDYVDETVGVAQYSRYLQVQRRAIT